MRVVVTGAAGMIGSNLVHGLNAIGIDDVIARRRPDRRPQVPQPARRPTQRLLRPARLLRPLRARRARPIDCGVPRGRLLRHDGARRPVHARPQLPLLEGPARRLPGAGHAPALRLLGGHLRRQRRVPRGARVRAAAQRLRLVEAAVRQRRAARAAGSEDAGRRLSLLQRLRAARAAQGPDGVGGLPPVQRSGRQTGRVKLFGEYGGYGPGEQRARLRLRRATWSRSTSGSSSIPRRAASSTSAPAGRSRSTTSPSPSSTPAARAARRDRRCRSTALVAHGVIEYIDFPQALVGKYQCFTEADLGAAARRRLRACLRRRRDRRRGVRRLAAAQA